MVCSLFALTNYRKKENEKVAFYWLWLKRVLFSSKTIFQFSALFSLFGLILAVASLTVAILSVNGFSSGLEKTLVDKQGHLRIQAKNNIFKEELLEDITDYKDFFSNQALFLSFEALILHEGRFKGVFFEAVQDEKLKSFSFLKNRILEGDLESSEPFVILGSTLAQELNLSVGSEVLVIVSQSEDSYFSRKQSQYKVSALVDFGRHEFNSRFVLMPLSSAQVLGMDKVSGVSLWLKRKDQTDFLNKRLKNTLEDSYFVSSWKDMDKNFFEVIESDKKIIFFVLFILIIAAGFNVSSSLFVQVFRKTKDISILRAMGAKKGTIRNLFLLNGLILGAFGTALGIFVALLLCYMLIFIQNRWRFLPAKVYKINEIVLDWQSMDMLLIFIVSLIVVILSSFLPANRAYKMNVKTGLSYD